MHDLGAYVEDGDLGSGGFADVVRAVHLVTKQRVALKKSRNASDARERTKREIEVQRLALHANIMRVLDWAADGSWFTMPLAVGDILKVRDDWGDFRDADILRLVEDCAAGLGTAHRNGLVHRDLSPRNILWVDDRWVVADWGYVRLPDGASRTQLTRAFSGIGTAPWAAPEAQTDGHAVDRRADIYSLGRIVGFLVTRVVPEPNKPSEIDASSPWAKFVRETTHADPVERPSTIYEALQYLEPVINALSSSREATIFKAADQGDTSRVAVDALKRYLVNPADRINLRELIMRETETVHAQLSPKEFPVQGHALDAESIKRRVDRYVEIVSPLISLMATGSAYGEDGQAEHWARMLRRIGEPLGEWGGTTVFLHMRYLPASMLMHAGAVASVATGRWATMRALVRDLQIRNRTRNDAELPAAVAFALLDAFDHDYAKLLPGMQNKYVPTSEWLFDQLREPLRFLLPSEAEYEDAFHRMEYLLALVYADSGARMYAPAARVAVHDAERKRFNGATVAAQLRAEADGVAKQVGGWASAAGLFPNPARVTELIDHLDKNWGSRGFY